MFSRSKKITCDRCKRSAKARWAVRALWTITNNDGQVPVYVCYECQTPEERSEAHGTAHLETFRSFGGTPIARLPGGTALTWAMPMGEALSLAQDESRSVTYMCRGAALREGAFLSESDVLPLGLPGGQLSSWPEGTFKMTVEFAAFATSDGWDALLAVIVDIAERKGRSDSGQAKGPDDS